MSMKLRLVRTKGESTDDASPAITPPSETLIFKALTFSEAGHAGQSRGFRVKVITADATDATITPWFRNHEDSTWSPGQSIVATSGVLYIEDDCGDADVFFRLTSMGAGGDPAEVWAEEMA